MRYLMAAVAVLTCPCHLPIWFALLAGTSFGAAASQYVGAAFVATSILFVASAWAALRFFAQQRQSGGSLRVPRSGRDGEDTGEVGPCPTLRK